MDDGVPGPSHVTSTGWIAFVFTNTFAYNGVSNLLIDFSFNKLRLHG
jgi:hypothetical protein